MGASLRREDYYGGNEVNGIFGGGPTSPNLAKPQDAVKSGVRT
jgi:hypothetical protein